MNGLSAAVRGSYFVALALAFSISQRALAAPDYQSVYPEGRINELRLVIEASDWAAMQQNMRKLYGEPGQGMPGGPGGPGGPGQPPPQDGPEFPKEKPMWVNAKVVFNGTQWSNVGVRYKGNSSLMSAWKSGSKKLPFKIDFEKYEPKRKFYGFGELSLSTSMGDKTYQREPLAFRLLAELGLPFSRTALYRVSVEYGEGEKILGLYTAIEVTNDTVVKGFFGEDEGNIYEGDGRGATLGKTVTPEQIKSSFEKENNKKLGDWSDVLNLQALLHDPRRLSDPAAWRASLERSFGVEEFLKWLAYGAVIEHWDAYGSMSHNFYLYNQGGKLQWISWDHNLILGAELGMGPGGPNPPPNMPNPPPGMPGGPMTFDRANVTDRWPLIRFLLDDPIYAGLYQEQLKAMRDRHFDAAKLGEEVRSRAALVRGALQPDELEPFERAVESLVRKLSERQTKLAEYLRGH